MAITPAAEEASGELEAFLKPINSEALKIRHEAREDLTAIQSLNVPNTLHWNLLSTVAIENSFRNARRKLGRVTRFRAETDQATRWLAICAMAEVTLEQLRVTPRFAPTAHTQPLQKLG